MILIESGQPDERGFDAKTLFAMQLAELGYEIGIDADTMPQGVSRGQKYDVSPFLIDAEDRTIRLVVLLDAENASTDALTALRRYSAPVVGTAWFTSAQNKIGTQAKIAFATGAEPTIIDLQDLFPRPIMENSIAPLCAAPRDSPQELARRPQILICLPSKFSDDITAVQTLDLLNNQSDYDIAVVIPGDGKHQIMSSAYKHINVFSYAELPPMTLANMSDMVVFMGERVHGERMAHLAMHAFQDGKMVIDSTSSAALIQTGAPALRGPLSLASLASYLGQSIMKNRSGIMTSVLESKWLEMHAMTRLEDAAGLSRPRKTTDKHDASTLFFPTNGNGLGHAQRCMLIADKAKDRKKVRFAAFPSCTTLIRNRGYDCLPLIQRSDSHPEPFANDIVNHLRLISVLGDDDHLVFDGGYVFESVLRAILTKRLKSTWIRRGLWRPSHINATALEREKAFDQVIVPHEAFESLNAHYSFDAKTKPVGPIVQLDPLDDAGRHDLRDKLKARFDRDFEKLTLTMLGGGVASDRSAQMQMIAARMDQRTDCLNLFMVWPNSTVMPALYGWKNSRVVTSERAIRLAQAADLTISAVGYNSFHETLYHQIPTIFLPQVAPFMDDQTRRARAASDEGLAITVEPHELLMLGREIDAYLDGDKSDQMRKNLAAYDLPSTGNADAARLVEGLKR